MSGASCQKDFQITIAGGCLFPDPPAVPADFGVADNTVVGTVTVCYTGPAPTSCVPADYTFGVQEQGEYTLEYVNGASFNPTGGGFFVVDQSVGFFDPTGQIWNYETNGFPNSNNLPFDTVSLYYPTQADAENAYAAFYALNPGPFSTFHSGGDEIKIVTFPAFTSGEPVSSGSPNPTWRLRRTKVLGFTPPARIRIANFAALKAALIPLFGATASADPEWDGTLPLVERLSDWAQPISWRADLTTPLSLNGFLLSNATKMYIGLGQPTASSSAWVPSIGFDNDPGVNWTGFGGSGYSPVGTATFRTDVAGNSISGEKTAVAAATAVALPSNTRTGNVLTATAVGAMPLIDGIALIVGDRVLVKNEVLSENNGWYVVSDVGSVGTPWILTRSTDADTSAEVHQGFFGKVTGGTVNGGCFFRLVTVGAIVLNTTGLDFLKIPSTLVIEAY